MQTQEYYILTNYCILKFSIGGSFTFLLLVDAPVSSSSIIIIIIITIITITSKFTGSRMNSTCPCTEICGDNVGHVSEWRLRHPPHADVVADWLGGIDVGTHATG